MDMAFALGGSGAYPLPVALSGRVVGQLGAAEQLVIWAFREAAGGMATAEPRLLLGFRLAFGEAGTGAAVCAFDGLRRCLLADPALRPDLCPLRCACLSLDEERLQRGMAAAQRGDRTTHRALLQPFVAPPLHQQLWRQSRLFAAALSQAGLFLPDRRLPELRGRATWH